MEELVERDGTRTEEQQREADEAIQPGRLNVRRAEAGEHDDGSDDDGQENDGEEAGEEANRPAHAHSGHDESGCGCGEVRIRQPGFGEVLSPIPFLLAPEEVIGPEDGGDAMPGEKHHAGADAQHGDGFEKGAPGIVGRGRILSVILDHARGGIRCPEKG